MRVLKEGCRRALANQGYRFAEFELSLANDESRAVASLEIEIRDEGPQAHIERVEVTGSDRDTAADVRNYLDLKPGCVCSEFQQALITYQLWKSGRYLSHQVEFVDSPAVMGASTLRIQLRDYPKAPSIAVSLSPVEAALLKCREWILATPQRGDCLDLAASTKNSSCRVSYSPRQGLLLRYMPRREQGCGVYSQREDGPHEFAVIARPESLSCLYEPWSDKFEVPLSGGHVVLRLMERPLEKPQADGNQFESSFSLGIHSRGNRSCDVPNKQVPLEFSLDLAPCAALALAHEYGAQCTLKEGVLSIDWANQRGGLRIEASTGRLLEFWIAQGGDEGARIHLKIGYDSFADHLNLIEEKLPEPFAELPNSYDSQRPLGSLVECLLRSPVMADMLSAMNVKPERTRDILHTCQCVRLLVTRGLLQPLDDLLAAQQPTPPNPFFIPLPREVDSRAQDDGMQGAVGAVGLLTSNLGFAPGTWPWQLSRDIGLWSFNRPRPLTDDLGSMESSKEIGPVALLVAAQLAEIVRPQQAGQLAWAGIDRLSLINFRFDYRALLKREKLAGALLYRAAEVLRDLDDKSISQLNAMIVGERHLALVKAVEELRNRRQENLEDVLPAVMETMWQNGIADVVASGLRSVYVRNFRIGRKNTDKETPADQQDAPEPRTPVSVLPRMLKL